MPILSKLTRNPGNWKIVQCYYYSRISHVDFKQSSSHENSVFSKRSVVHHRLFSSDTKSNFRNRQFAGSMWVLIASSVVAASYALWNVFRVDGNKPNIHIEPVKRSFPRCFPMDIVACSSKSDAAMSSSTGGQEVPGLPTYTASDVAKHDSLEKRIWVSYKSGVYDITDFVPKHPGGDKILMGAGGSLEPFWELFAIHKDRKIQEMLEEYRIGNLSPMDREEEAQSSNDPFATDPRRHPILMPRSTKPFNAEPPPELLVENFITPNELFFVRNHLPVPEVDPDTYQLEISGVGIKSMHLTLQDLKTKFKKRTITSTVQCAGNRRSELNKVNEVKGLFWGSAAISNARWTGVRLVDVLKYAKVDLDDERIQHVQFEGLDTDPASMPYGASIPAAKGLDPKSDILLAFEMNGEELPRDHGYPVRVIVPGVVGARNVKWLGKIVVSEEESKSHWQKNDYKGFSPSTTWENVDFNTSPAIQELPVNSAICKPLDNDKITLDDNALSAAGYAWSGGGRKIVRVDISIDQGKTWHNASLEQDESSLYKSWSWTLWKISIPVAKKDRKKGSEIEILCKAVDSSYNVQPDTFPPIWNLRGVLGNAWHKVKVKIQ